MNQGGPISQISNRRVCVTGIGIVSPLGNDVEATWQNVVAGKSVAAPIKSFDADTWPTTFACEVTDFNLSNEAVSEEHKLFLNRPSEFGIQAALEAMKNSGIDGKVDTRRLGVSIGASIGAVSPHRLAKLLTGLNLSEGTTELPTVIARSNSAHMVLQNHPGTLAGVIGARWQARGPVSTIHTACASSGQSIGQAYLQIKRGDADAVIAGGADSLAGEILLAGFCLIGALSKRNHDPKGASRPFDKDRDGFVASEGAAMLILEEREHAIKRGANIIAELVGYGETESAYRITDLPPNGRGIVEAMHIAINDSGMAFDQVGYVNAHGTSTELNDRIEALAIRRVFGSRNCKPMVSSTKSETGHLISAAGALEAAFCVLALRDGVIPPTANLHDTDCGDDIDFVALQPRRKQIEAALSNSIGFGGTNTAILFRRASH
jgi:3-oxoacyl-[acyl-carrier-protein] synthase II